MKNTLFLPDELLKNYNFFELYPFDGGGYFIQQEIVHSLDDREITRNILNGALDDFGPLDAIDFNKFEFWRSIEKSCWINRMYFIVPLARCAMLEHNRALAEQILRIIRYFNANFLPPPDKQAVQELEREVFIRRDRDYNSGNAQGAIPYQWFDFQPASRIVNGLNAWNFLREFNLPEADFRLFIANNARVIYDAADEHRLTDDNHQTLRGLALLYAGHYLDNPEYRRAGSVVANHHLLHDYCSDGMGVDMSPSYHVFVSWISRDAVRLGDIAPAGLAQFQKACRICREFCQPDNHSIVLNDGYSLDLRGFLSSINQPLDEQTGTFAMPYSGMAFYHSPQLFAALDASLCLAKYSHFHAGKNAVTLWFGNRPLLADSACCSYDNPLFWEWFKQPQAHSTLLVNGRGDAELRGRYEWNNVTSYHLGEWQNEQIVCASDIWQRQLQVASPRQVKIGDQVNCPEESMLEFIFVLHPTVEVELQNDAIILKFGGQTAKLTWQSALPVAWRIEPGKFFAANQIVDNHRLIAQVKAQKFNWETVWTWAN